MTEHNAEDAEGVFLRITDADITAHMHLRPLKPETVTKDKVERLLVADRGNLANRIIKTAKSREVHTIAIFVPGDETSLHVSNADESVALIDVHGYKDAEGIIRIAKENHCDAVIVASPRDAAFIEAVVDAGLTWIGPRPDHVRTFASERTAMGAAIAAGVFTLPGFLINGASEKAVIDACRKLGYPVVLRKTKNAGISNALPCHDEEHTKKTLQELSSPAQVGSTDVGILVERYLSECHLIEVQIFGDGKGRIIVLGERESSIQGRSGALLIECPSPFLQNQPGVREKLHRSARSLAETAKYESIGTVKFLMDDQTIDISFLGIDTGLSITHPVTELCYDVDLVDLMLKHEDLKLGGKGGLSSQDMDDLQNLSALGVAMQASVYAEDASKDLTPSAGTLTEVHWGEIQNSRIDTWVRTGVKIDADSDPLLAKIVSHAKNRTAAIKGLEMLVARTEISGVSTNLDHLFSILSDDKFRSGRTVTTSLQNGKQ